MDALEGLCDRYDIRRNQRIFTLMDVIDEETTQEEDDDYQPPPM